MSVATVLHIGTGCPCSFKPGLSPLSCGHQAGCGISGVSTYSDWYLGLTLKILASFIYSTHLLNEWLQLPLGTLLEGWLIKSERRHRQHNHMKKKKKVTWNWCLKNSKFIFILNGHQKDSDGCIIYVNLCKFRFQLYRRGLGGICKDQSCSKLSPASMLLLGVRFRPDGRN